MSEDFDKKVAKLVGENLRHDPEKTDWAWRHVHTAKSDQDPVWQISKEGMSEEVADKDQGNEEQAN